MVDHLGRRAVGKVRTGVAAASASAMTRPKGSGQVITTVCRAIPGTGGSDRRPGSSRCDQAAMAARRPG